MSMVNTPPAIVKKAKSRRERTGGQVCRTEEHFPQNSFECSEVDIHKVIRDRDEIVRRFELKSFVRRGNDICLADRYIVEIIVSKSVRQNPAAFASRISDGDDGVGNSIT